jgi:hypothetical protein
VVAEFFLFHCSFILFTPAPLLFLLILLLKVLSISACPFLVMSSKKSKEKGPARKKVKREDREKQEKEEKSPATGLWPLGPNNALVQLVATHGRNNYELIADELRGMDPSWTYSRAQVRERIHTLDRKGKRKAKSNPFQLLSST